MQVIIYGECIAPTLVRLIGQAVAFIDFSCLFGNGNMFQCFIPNNLPCQLRCPLSVVAGHTKAHDQIWRWHHLSNLPTLHQVLQVPYRLCRCIRGHAKRGRLGAGIHAAQHPMHQRRLPGGVCVQARAPLEQARPLQHARSGGEVPAEAPEEPGRCHGCRRARELFSLWVKQPGRTDADVRRRRRESGRLWGPSACRLLQPSRGRLWWW